MVNLSVQKSKLIMQNKNPDKRLQVYPPELNPVELEMRISDVTEVLGYVKTYIKNQ